MVSRFRPTYSYRNLINSLFADYIRSEKILTEWAEDNFKSKNIFFYSFARVGLYAFLASLKLKGGVISPAYNCIVVPDSVRFAKMENQFCDISLDDYNMSPKSVENTIDSQSKVILATHQYGIPCDVESLGRIAKKNDLFLFEDSAAALGGKIEGKLAGSFGDASLISFQDTKTINSVNGGCLIVHNKNIAEKIKKTYFKSSVKDKMNYFKKGMIYKMATEPIFYRFVFEYFTRKSGRYTLREVSLKKIPKDFLSGLNIFSLNLIVEQIKDLEKIVEKKNKIANVYSEKINPEKTSLSKVTNGTISSWERYPIRVKDSVNFFKKMTKKGVDMAWTFNYTCPEELKQDDKMFPNAREAADTVICLPIYKDLSLQRAEKIAFLVNQSS